MKRFLYSQGVCEGCNLLSEVVRRVSPSSSSSDEELQSGNMDSTGMRECVWENERKGGEAHKERERENDWSVAP
ncbi:hypothetical protein QQF64_025555 [Cirrhinus molitorella]|uniref:Uncharacterized protein n=1 Tax=Cirrhinus molitorella TaxID=172907 RepID=A0ABR3NPE3_9TELE